MNRIWSDEIQNWIGRRKAKAISKATFQKYRPSDGSVMGRVSRSGAEDVRNAVQAAREAQSGWAALPAVQRGEVLYHVAFALKQRRTEMAEIVADETGKSLGAALGETDGAVALGLFMAGEGQRLYGRTTTSGTPDRYVMTVRQPMGVAGLIIAANTPIANVAWKVFPALVCGNAAVLKAAEDAPATAAFFMEIAHEAGLPPGVLNLIQGFGSEAGAPLVENEQVDVISFTGSTGVGRQIAVTAGQRLAKVSLELGGKNPFVVCDDADLDNAVKWAILSAFSNAGQRCSSGSRLIVFDSVYDQFKAELMDQTRALRVGVGKDDAFGPVINQRQLDKMLAAVASAEASGATILTGGRRLTGPEHASGYYMAPTLIENVDPQAEISVKELFGPIACLYRVKDFAEALRLSNDSAYGLTACIHTQSVHRAMEFTHAVQSGVAVVNAGTFGSEPHMPFGGVKQSGNGSREPGTEALDVYSSVKDVYINVNPRQT